MLSRMKFLIILTLIAVRRSNGQKDSLSLTIANMVELLSAEDLFLHQMKAYAAELHQHWQKMNSILERLTAENLIASKGGDNYLTDPINAFTLVTRMHQDARRLVQNMQEPIAQDAVTVLTTFNWNLPTSEDFEAAVVGISSLQTVNEMSVADMAAGLLDGVQHNCSLKSIDCFAIGSELFRRSEHKSAADWLFTALQLYEEGPVNVVTNYSQLEIVTMYKNSLLQQVTATESINEDTPSLSSAADGCLATYNNPLTNLYCLYHTATTYFTRLAPIKLEILSLDPYIAIYYDVLYDAEIDAMKALVAEELHSSRVVGPQLNMHTFDEGTSNFSTMEHNAADSLAQIHERIQDMTGISLEQGEQIQVINYDLGAHHMPQQNGQSMQELPELAEPDGQSLVTLVFYLSDVVQGGATYFPDVGIAVPARRGTALLWHNFDNRGALAQHIDCPVLSGPKWSVHQIQFVVL